MTFEDVRTKHLKKQFNLQNEKILKKLENEARDEKNEFD